LLGHLRGDLLVDEGDVLGRELARPGARARRGGEGECHERDHDGPQAASDELGARSTAAFDATDLYALEAFAAGAFESLDAPSTGWALPTGRLTTGLWRTWISDVSGARRARGRQGVPSKRARGGVVGPGKEPLREYPIALKLNSELSPQDDRMGLFDAVILVPLSAVAIELEIDGEVVDQWAGAALPIRTWVGSTRS
jgi:hypothetical protein